MTSNVHFLNREHVRLPKLGWNRFGFPPELASSLLSRQESLLSAGDHSSKGNRGRKFRLCQDKVCILRRVRGNPHSSHKAVWRKV